MRYFTQISKCITHSRGTLQILGKKKHITDFKICRQAHARMMNLMILSYIYYIFALYTSMFHMHQSIIHTNIFLRKPFFEAKKCLAIHTDFVFGNILFLIVLLWNKQI